MLRTRAPLKPFRAFVSNKYYENRDEYARCGQTQPYTLEEYVEKNLNYLKDLYRQNFLQKEVDKPGQ